jgi:hypothetical protein
MTPEIDRISDEFASSVIASYSTLDMLYEYFIYLTHEPFGEPKFPSKFHFSDVVKIVFKHGGSMRSYDIGPDILPYAIPNLVSGSFSKLRLLRNDLVHNMVLDSHRPLVFIGIGSTPVGELPIQYVQYLCRDVEANGRPLVHTWTRRFYTQQRDAPMELYDLIELVWQFCFDTVKWLTHRLESIGK